MKKVQVLGPGCAKCMALADLVRRAAEETRTECAIEKVTALESILAFGVMTTPALVVDGVVRSVGKLPTLEQVKGYLA
jgi:small redox-active disulfide protein 2